MASRKRSISNDADVSALYKELDETSCPICMEHPHNAVLLICSSHEKGCRSYICDTSYRHSNCLDQYTKLRAENMDSLSTPSLTPRSEHDSINTSTRNSDMRTTSDLTGDNVNHIRTASNIAASAGTPGGSGGSSTRDADSNFEEQNGTLWGRHLGETNTEKLDPKSILRCPLCRGSVLSCKIVEETRKYLDLKSRSCSHESCSFFGNYRELRQHARRVHPRIRPADVDPSREQAWRHLEDRRAHSDIVSAIRSVMPGAIVLGDYVIESGDRLLGARRRGARQRGRSERRRWFNTFMLQMIGSMEPGAELRGGWSRAPARHRLQTGTFSTGRHLLSENLLGLQDDEGGDDEDDEMDMNILSNAGDDVPPNPRRRRRLTRARSDEDRA
ncbi:Protein of unknown function (DUF1644) [Abeliophyllum distichum]|uniref:Uncharacterized protein n=1 Tax=Abeliophyllum distichum TaxID=126358 RepID=A0ABD1RCH6_9LAMI